MREIKILILFAVIAITAGCGTLQINHIVTGTQCQSREECIKDLGLDKQPEKPDVVFVVEPLLMNEKGKAPVGTPALTSPVYYGNVELCVAKALRTEFKNAKIILDDKSPHELFIRVKLIKIVQQGVIPALAYMRIDYDITANGKTVKQYARTNSECFWDFENEAKKQYPLVCAILSRQVREFIEQQSKTISKTAGE